MAPRGRIEVNTAAKWTVAELLELKSKGESLSEEQISFLVQGITSHAMDDCQLGAFLMTIMLRGMSMPEVTALTQAMRDSGAVLTWPPAWSVVDKHSTGGVGDKVSLALAPALAVLGLRVPMISGRGLGHTGGTLDKLESIPGFKAGLSQEEMLAGLESAGCVIVGQTSDMVPADRRMYAARDVSATVRSIPLIVSSIVSKKAAASPQVLVLDVKFGSGAFMIKREKAEEMGRALVAVAEGLGINTVALLTENNSPIGRTVGNALEVWEAVDCLRGGGPPDLRELVVHLGAEAAVGGGVAATAEEGRAAVAAALDDGSALATFGRMLQAQGVSEEVANQVCAGLRDVSSTDSDVTNPLPTARHRTPVVASASGVVGAVDALTVAQVSAALGAGRTRVADPVDHGVGVVLLKVVGEAVRAGEAWAELHHNTALSEGLLHVAQDALTLLPPDTSPFPLPSLILDRFALK